MMRLMRRSAGALALVILVVATAPTTAEGGPAIQTLPTVRLGASGENVTTIQYLLRHHGADVVVDGDFGPQTEQAVQAFQRANGLDPDGVVGPRTWPALFVTVRLGDEGDAVRAVQGQLAARGIEVEVDGDFGEQTEGAVRAFQQQVSLAVDGVVGPRTWAALVGQGQPQGPLPAAGRYTLHNGSTLTVLGSGPDRKVSLQAPDGGASQTWVFEDGPDGHVFLRNLATGFYLESGPEEGFLDVSTQVKSGGESQQWNREPQTSGRVLLRNRANGRVLARVLPFSPDNPGAVYTTPLAAGAQGVPSVQWRLEAAQP